MPEPELADLVIVAGGGVRRVAVVCTNRDLSVTVRLAHPYLEYATDLDLIIHPPETGFHDARTARWCYPLVIGHDLHVAVHRTQIVEVIGNIGTGACAAICASTRTDGESLDGHLHGPLPLSGRHDPRRKFKHEELDDVLTLRGVAKTLQDANNPSPLTR